MNEAEKLHDLVADFTDAMLVTASLDGHLRARPMRIARLEDDNDLWFITSSKSGKIDEIDHNPNVSVTLQGGGKYISLSGTAAVDTNRSKIDELWREPLKVWFPEGKKDPRVTLLRVDVAEGEYWDNAGASGLKYLVKAGTAYLRGSEPEIDENIHSKVKS